MSQPQDSGGLLAWILGGIAIFGALWAAGKRIFSTVTRDELGGIVEAQNKKFLETLETQRTDFKSALDQMRADRLRLAEEQRAEQLRLHAENRDTSREMFGRISDLEKGQSRIEGTLSARFPRPDQR